MSPTLTSWIFSVVALLMLLRHALTWQRTSALHGRINRRLIRQMPHLCQYTGHRWYLFLSFLLLGLFACIALLGVSVSLVGRLAFSGQGILRLKFMLRPARSGTRRGLPEESGSRALNEGASDYSGVLYTAQCRHAPFSSWDKQSGARAQLSRPR